ncbi:uncharacterized protein LOC115977925 [Quercus lobata]|uniref:uncharacterized protein LOC115977925 n=1 Tax=Quercus lobata TaxID=97700 RepID=UPI001244EB4D|nr:uncharacterized protein LOC115977925 [Quercus lobata]
MLLTILSGWLFVEKRKLGQVFPEEARKIWDLWELRILVLISLTLQISLIVLGNRRKYNPNTLLRLSLWSAYLTADWVATVALGVLSKNQRNSCTCAIASSSNTKSINDELRAFWAPFLLLHLGGPDTITAYALADNELWIRHLLGLLVQTIVAIYITVTAWSGTWLSYLTIPMLFAGLIKYVERTLSLRSANREQFLDSLLYRPDPGPNYAKFMEEFSLKKAEGFSVLAIEVIEAADQSYAAGNGNNNGDASKRTLPVAYSFFNTFKRLFVDLILSFHDRDKSRSYFQNLTSSETAFEVVEIELGFAYDVFYTKAPIISTFLGCIFRFITSSFTIIVFVFFLIIEKHNHPQVDLIITYILLVGAILLEFYAVILLLSSDWTKLWLSEHEPQFSQIKRCFQSMISRPISCFEPIVSPLVSCFQSKVSPLIFCFKSKVSPLISWFQSKISPLISCFKSKVSSLISCFQSKVSRLMIPCFRHVISEVVSFLFPSNKKRWSNSIPQFNLLSFSLKDKPVPCLDDKPELFQKIVRHSPIYYKTFEKSWYTYRCETSPKLKGWIFQHFLKKSEVATSTKKPDDNNTSSLCSARGNLVFKNYIEKYERSLSFNWTTEVEFDQSILIWHIATDLCYHSGGGENLAAENSSHKWSKNLSDYMLYLLVMCPFLLPIGIGMIRFQDTCEEAKHFFQEKGLSKNKVKFCKMLLEVNTDVEPIKVKGDRSKSVLFNANKLAKQLQEMGEEKNWEFVWEFVCDVWIEILGYAASHCRGYYHAQQLTEGGELLTHVWLLMAHLGITEQFQINRGHARAKLAVY